MKSSNQIMDEVITVIDLLGIDIDLVYKNFRPSDSLAEDCVVSLIAGQCDKFIQTGAIYVKMFFADINLNNTYFQDTLKSEIKEGLLFDLSELLIKMFSYDVDSREISTEQVFEIHQHYSILKMNYKFIY